MLRAFRNNATGNRFPDRGIVDVFRMGSGQGFPRCRTSALRCVHTRWSHRYWSRRQGLSTNRQRVAQQIICVVEGDNIESFCVGPPHEWELKQRIRASQTRLACEREGRRSARGSRFGVAFPEFGYLE